MMEGNNVLCIDLCLHHISGVDLLIRLITKVSQVMNHRASRCSCKSSIGSLANCRVSEISWLLKSKPAARWEMLWWFSPPWPSVTPGEWSHSPAGCLFTYSLSVYKRFRLLLLFLELVSLSPMVPQVDVHELQGPNVNDDGVCFPQPATTGHFH